MGDVPSVMLGACEIDGGAERASDPPCRSSGAIASGYGWLKAGVEWIAAAVLMLLAAPVIGGLAVLLKLTSRGPVFYSQMRLGRFGRPFRIYKLRTMTDRCEAATGPVWSVPDDPRVTRVGRWLRDTHLDELPQLWNVLRGEMSLIGPRPERPEIAGRIEEWLPGFRDRLQVRPGITGLAQLRLSADFNLHTVRQKLTHDRQYIHRMGPTLDACIAMSTVLHLAGAAAIATSRQLIHVFVPAQPAMCRAAIPELIPIPVDAGRYGHGRPATVIEDAERLAAAIQYPGDLRDRPSRTHRIDEPEFVATSNCS